METIKQWWKDIKNSKEKKAYLFVVFVWALTFFIDHDPTWLVIALCWVVMFLLPDPKKKQTTKLDNHETEQRTTT